MEKEIEKEIEKLLNGFLTEVLPGGQWQTYTEPKIIAEKISKLFTPKTKPIEERKCPLDHKALKRIHKYNHCFNCGINLENYT